MFSEGAALACSQSLCSLAEHSSGMLVSVCTICGKWLSSPARSLYVSSAWFSCMQLGCRNANSDIGDSQDDVQRQPK